MYIHYDDDDDNDGDYKKEEENREPPCSAIKHFARRLYNIKQRQQSVRLKWCIKKHSVCL